MANNLLLSPAKQLFTDGGLDDVFCTIF